MPPKNNKINLNSEIKNIIVKVYSSIYLPLVTKTATEH